MTTAQTKKKPAASTGLRFVARRWEPQAYQIAYRVTATNPAALAWLRGYMAKQGWKLRHLTWEREVDVGPRNTLSIHESFMKDFRKALREAGGRGSRSKLSSPAPIARTTTKPLKGIGYKHTRRNEGHEVS
jgi:hypothetical protein